MSNNEQKTAVEWLIQQLTEVDYNCINKTFLQNNETLSGIRMKQIFKKALQMEYEQKTNAFEIGREVQRNLNNEKQ
jgi:hypothetical protein